MNMEKTINELDVLENRLKNIVEREEKGENVSLDKTKTLIEISNYLTSVMNELRSLAEEEKEKEEKTHNHGLK